MPLNYIMVSFKGGRSTALRITAGMELRWDWIDWNENTITMPAEHNKSHKVHCIPMADKLRNLLLELRGEKKPQAGNYVFPCITERTLRTRLKETCDMAEIDMNGICFHCLRHTAATMLCQNVGIETARDILGHANIATTNRYVHSSKKSRIEGVAALNKMVSL